MNARNIPPITVDTTPMIIWVVVLSLPPLSPVSDTSSNSGGERDGTNNSNELLDDAHFIRQFHVTAAIDGRRVIHQAAADGDADRPTHCLRKRGA